MRVIGVIDLRGGRAVHAQGADRGRYAPVAQVAGIHIEPGAAAAVARTYIEYCGVSELYVADLDAIVEGTPPSPAVAALAELRAPLWIDAGMSTIEQARDVANLGATYSVIGLETLGSLRVIADICATLGGEHVAFSLDLRGGRPLGCVHRGDSPNALAAHAADAGVGAIIVLDLARVGTVAGLDLALLANIRRAAPDVVLVAGGGVRGLEDLRRLADCGCDGALVATALLAGILTPCQVSEARAHQPNVSL